MQSEQLILQRLETIALQLDEVARRQRAFDELYEELTPIAREMIAAAAARLDALDKQGFFDLLEGLRGVTQARPMGAFRALRATRDDDVQKGLGIMIDVLRRIGHGANGAPAADGKALDQKAKLAALVAPRRTRLLPAPAPARAAAPAQPVARAADDRPIDPATWTHAIAEAIARNHGITLDERRWALIDAARADFASTKASPNIQRLTSVAHVTTKDLYQLFPKAPARTIAKIAGLPKPAGCL